METDNLSADAGKTIPSHLSGAKLALLCGVPERTLQRVATAAGIESDRVKGGLDVEAMIRALVAHYRDQAEQLDVEAARDRARRNKAEADMAELDREEKAKKLAPRDELVDAWKDFLVRARKTIEKFPGMNLAQKKKLAGALAQIELVKSGDE